MHVRAQLDSAAAMVKLEIGSKQIWLFRAAFGSNQPNCPLNAKLCFIYGNNYGKDFPDDENHGISPESITEIPHLLRASVGQ